MFPLGLLLSALVHQAVYAVPNCPQQGSLLGTSFPPPRNLSGSSVIQAASTNLTNAIDNDTTLERNETSFSIEIFTTTTTEPLFQYHHSAPSLASSTSGVKTVDSNSVYRIGSISKLFTVFTFLIEAGDAHWNDPITDYVPELKSATQQSTDSFNSVQWDDVTVGALASQMAGIARDYSFGDFLASAPDQDWTLFGLPPLNATEVLTCGANLTSCGREDFFKGLITRRPVFAPFSTPIYSNVAFQILSYALEDITNKTFRAMLEDDIFKPLGMSSSSYSLPTNSSSGVIPVNDTASSWSFDLGEEGPAGGLYSTTSDLSKLGRGILQSTLLPPAQTRRWMKPHSHTSLFSLSVGAPWEIIRFVHPTENRIIDIYTKTGDVGLYSSIIALIPEYNLGFNILAAGAAPHADAQALSEIIGEAFIPQLESVAREEANARFAGTYSSAQNSTNSTVVLSTAEDKPGFSIDTWISNGTDVLTVLPQVLRVTSVTLTLYPTDIVSNDSYAFRLILQVNVDSIDNGPFSWDCVHWADVNNLRYGGTALDDFVFTLGGDGQATELEPRVTRLSLSRSK